MLLELPFKHKGLYCAPFLGPISIGKYLDSGQIEQVACGGENYGGTRPCDFEWEKALREECVLRDITFCFMETGTVFIKDGTKFRTIEDPLVKKIRQLDKLVDELARGKLMECILR